jgi:hypothetical protein
VFLNLGEPKRDESFKNFADYFKTEYSPSVGVGGIFSWVSFGGAKMNGFISTLSSFKGGKPSIISAKSNSRSILSNVLIVDIF